MQRDREKLDNEIMMMFREMEEMRRAREAMTEDDYMVSNERSEATRELEAFRLFSCIHCYSSLIVLNLGQVKLAISKKDTILTLIPTLIISPDPKHLPKLQR